jgi:HlyD family secretion protein
MKRVLVALAVVAVLAAAGSGYWLVRAKANNHSDRVRVSGNIEVTDAAVSFKIAGRVQERLVDEGAMVEKGQLVARLDSSDLELDVAMRKAELAQAEVALGEATASRPDELAAADAAAQKAQSNLDLLKAGFREEEIEVARHSKLQAEAELKRAESEYRRAERLIESNKEAISRENFDRAQAAYEVALQAFNEADWQLRKMEKGSRTQQIEAAQAALDEARANYGLVKSQEKIERARAARDQAQAALGLAETRLGYATLCSPLSGVVLSKNIEPGEYVAPGTPVVTVGDLEHTWLRAYIDERDLGRVKLGQEVVVTTDTFPDKEYRGRVSFIASQAEFTPKNVQTQKERVKLVYRIKVDIPNPQMELKPGMPADAEILVNSVDSAASPSE